MINTSQSKQDKLQALFEKNGLRNTSQRRDVYEYLIKTSSHPTARQIFEQLKPDHPTLSLATVYNTLDLLVGAGLINALGEIGDNQVHFDGDTSSHANLACTECFKIVDVPEEKTVAVNSAIKETGFSIYGSRVVYYGICPECQLKHNQEIKGASH